MLKRLLIENGKSVVTLLGCLCAASMGVAHAITFNYLVDTTSSCGTLSVLPTGAIVCNSIATGGVPFNFQNPLSCESGLSVSMKTGAVKCATSLPVCTLTAIPATAAPGETIRLTASCSNDPIAFQWRETTGLAPGGGGTASVTLPRSTSPGMYAYSVMASNAKGSGNVASTLVKVGSASQAGPLAYIATAGNKLTVMDTSSGTVAATLAVGGLPVGVAVNAAGTYAYVSNQGENTVSVVDTSSNKVATTIGVGLYPLGVAIDPKGARVYVANSGNKSISVIDAYTNKVLTTVAVGNTPSGVAVNPAGTRVYVTNQGDNTVSEIDVTKTPYTVKSISVGSMPYGVDVAGASVYVANNGASTVSVIDTSVAPYTISTVNVGLKPHGVAAHPLGTFVYVVNNGDRTVSVIDTASRTLTNTLTVGATPTFVAFNQTGTLAYVLNQGANTVSVIDVAAQAVIPSGEIAAAAGLYAFGKFMTPASYQGMWWNPAENGWGMSVTQHGGMIFNGLYTYDQAGQPVWYVMSECPMNGRSCSGEIYRASGGTSPTQAWDGAKKVVNRVGSGTLTFADANSGTFNFDIDGVAGTKQIERQIFATGTTVPATNYTDLWWNENESGWGVALTRQNDMVFAVLYSYDVNGKAIWYVASSCPVVGNACAGELYQVIGGSALTSTWNGTAKVVTKVGAISFSFSDANRASMTYTINGVAGSRNIIRQGF